MSKPILSKNNTSFSDEFAVMSSEFTYMKQEVQEMKQIIKDGFKELNDKIDAQNVKSEQKYVTKEEFDLIKRIVYGGITVVLLAALAFLLKTVYGWG